MFTALIPVDLYSGMFKNMLEIKKKCNFISIGLVLMILS